MALALEGRARPRSEAIGGGWYVDAPSSLGWEAYDGYPVMICMSGAELWEVVYGTYEGWRRLRVARATRRQQEEWDAR